MNWSAIIVNIKNKNIRLRVAIIISLFGILGAIVGANISINIDVKILKKCFGVFLAIIAINEIYSIVKEYKKENILKDEVKYSDNSFSKDFSLTPKLTYSYLKTDISATERINAKDK